MRVASWDPTVLNELKIVAYDRLLDASYFCKDKIAQRLRGRIGGSERGHPPTTGISRPPYKTGPYAGQAWTARNFGQLLQSVRVVEKKDKEFGRVVSEYANVRVYAGNKLAYYADIFEFYTPFFRPTFYESIPQMKSILGAE